VAYEALISSVDDYDDYVKRYPPSN